MISLSIAVINSRSFQEGLKKAIESGIETDWEYNGEDETPVERFDSSEALKAVTSFLKTHINK